MSMNKKLRWGVLGCASIAKRAVIPGLAASRFNEVTAIASRDENKARETAEELEIPVSYGTYEALLEDPSIDAVYIPLPNHLHKEWSIRAAEAGKHVLCEKPIALTAAEAAEMAGAAEKAGVLLAEAFMYRHHPRYDMIQELIGNGSIGEIRAIHSSFTFNSSGNTGNVRFRRDWGGGSIYDIGCYPINAARLLLNREPEAVTVQAFFSPEHDHVDMMASGLIEFGGSVSLTFDCGMWAAGRNPLEIIGSEGMIEVPHAYSIPEGRADFFLTSGGERKEIKVPEANAYSEQGDRFAEAVFSGQPLRFGPDDAVRNMKVIDACLLSARDRIRVTL